MEKIGVMFVCLGNICRSPMAEAVFRELVKGSGFSSSFVIQSCGTAGYHIGSNADPRTLSVLSKHNVPIQHKAQQLKQDHTLHFQYFAVMDDENLQNTLAILDDSSAVFKIRDYDDVGVGEDLNDPYYGGAEGFDLCFDQLMRSCHNFLQFLIEKHNLTKD